MGEYLTKLLNEKGIETIHDTGVYDIINGQLDRSNAYENAEASIRPILEANPSVEVVIDLSLIHIYRLRKPGPCTCTESKRIRLQCDHRSL